MDEWFVWLARLMFVAIFPLGFGMLFRAWRVGTRKDSLHTGSYYGLC